MAITCMTPGVSGCCRRCCRRHQRFGRLPLLPFLLLLSLIASPIVSGQVFVNDPSNEDTLIVPASQEDGDGGSSDEEGGGCDGRSETEEGDVISPVAGDHDLRGYERWDEHFAKERAKLKSAAAARAAARASPSRRRLRDRVSFSPTALLFRRRRPFKSSSTPIPFDADEDSSGSSLISDHKEADFASEDHQTDASSADDEALQLQQPSSSSSDSLRSLLRQHHRLSDHRVNSRRHRYHFDDDLQDLPDYHEDPVADLIASRILRTGGRQRHRSSLSDHRHRDDDQRRSSSSLTERLKRKLFGG